MSGFGWITLALYLGVVAIWLVWGFRVLVRPGLRRPSDIRQILLLTLVVAGLSAVQLLGA